MSTFEKDWGVYVTSVLYAADSTLESLGQNSVFKMTFTAGAIVTILKVEEALANNSLSYKEKIDSIEKLHRELNSIAESFISD